MKSIYKDVGGNMTVHVLSDANADLGIIKRRGFSKTRHLDTNWLWIQEKNANKSIEYSKLSGSNNAADLFTKYLDKDTIAKHMQSLGFQA